MWRTGFGRTTPSPLQSRAAKGFALAARAAYSARAPCTGGARFLFAEKKPGKEKAERGTSRPPLHSPPKGRPTGGRPNKGQKPPVFAVTCLAWQYNAFLIGRKLPPKWHRTGAIPPQRKFSPVAHWGECRGGSAPSALSFPPLSLAKKAVLPPSRRPVRRGHPPAWLDQIAAIKTHTAPQSRRTTARCFC